MQKIKKCFALLALIFAQHLSADINIDLISDRAMFLYEKYRYVEVDGSGIYPEVRTFPFSDYSIVKVPNQGSFYIDKQECIKSFLARGEIWEPLIADLIRKHTRKNSIALDIGAHIGTHTITMASSVGNGGIVLSFEPQRKIHKELIMNCKLNNCLNVFPFYCALGEYHGVAYLSEEQPYNEGERYISSKHPVEPIPMLTLDELSLDNVSFIKIDVESYEKEVLVGATQTILRNKPIILIEIGGGLMREEEEGIDGQQYLQSVLNMLESKFSYKTFLITTRDYLAIPL